MKDSKYYKKKLQQNKKNKIGNTSWLSKVLISIIIILLSLILTNFNKDIKEFYTKNILEYNLSFNQINKIYEKYIGNINKEKVKTSDTNYVSNEITDIKLLPKTEEDGSYKIDVGLDFPVTFQESGIIVFIGDKESLKNTVIVQGNDGVDIWYSNIIHNDYSLYDYVKKGDILGTTNTDNLILTITKDGKKLTYDEYFK